MNNLTEEEKENIYNKIKLDYKKQSDIKYAAARIWIDDIINPEDTRYVITRSLDMVNRRDSIPDAKYGVLQV